MSHDDVMHIQDIPSSPLYNSLGLLKWNPSTATTACHCIQFSYIRLYCLPHFKILSWSYTELFRTKMSTLVEKLTAEGEGASAGE